MQLKTVVLFFLMGITGLSWGQDRDTISVLSYNLLHFPGGTPGRVDTLRTILDHIKPDIFAICELTNEAGANAILSEALNHTEPEVYAMAEYMDSPDSQNELFYNTNKFVLYEQNRIPTVLRDINEYVLYYKTTDLAVSSDTIFFYIYVCHLKASEDYAVQRNTEVLALKNYLSARGRTENVIVAGDFNFYGSDIEPAWNTLLNTGAVPLKDPLVLPGHWHNNAGFGWAHTQSTRTLTFNGGAYGGMDDRFDFIFIGTDLRNYANDARYINGSYRAVGQDGLHFNKAIIDDPVNTSEPFPIISALYHMSDHLPVYLEIEVVKEAAGIDSESRQEIHVFYNAEKDGLELAWDSTLQITEPVRIYNLAGHLVDQMTNPGQSSFWSTEGLDPGVYIFKAEDSQFSFKFVKQ